jgi:hypothetical protein
VAYRKVLDEGVSFGVSGRVTRFSDAEAINLRSAALASWRRKIAQRGRMWPHARWPNPPVARTEATVRRLARRYGFRVMRLVWQTPRQLAPELVIRTAHYRGAGRAMLLLTTRAFTGYEGYYVEADDERGVPFDYVTRYRRGPSGGGRGWARSDAVAPYTHL